MSDGSTESRFRVQVHELDVTGQWKILGVGFLALDEFIDQTSFAFSPIVQLTVSNENDGHVILTHEIDSAIEYQKQEYNILAWSDLKGKDIAVSFLSRNALNEVFEAIEASLDTSAGSSFVLNIPWPILDNLSIIADALAYVPATRQQAATIEDAFINCNYLERIYHLFGIAEDLAEDDPSKLFPFFQIILGLFMVNSNKLLKTLLHHDNILQTIACLEYDKGIIGPKDYHQHRNFLSSAKLKQVIPVDDPCIVQLIENTYLISYIKDAILLQYIDDFVSTSFLSIVVTHTNRILDYFQESPTAIPLLLEEIMRDQPANLSTILDSKVWLSKQDHILMLNHFCLMADSVDIDHRSLFIRRLVSHKIVSCIDFILSHSSPFNDAWLWRLVIDVLYRIVEIAPDLSRDELLGKEDNDSLRVIVSAFSSFDICTGLLSQISDFMRLLLEGDILVKQRPQHNHILTFCDNYLHDFISPLFHSGNNLNGSQSMTLLSSKNIAATCLTYLVSSFPQELKSFIGHLQIFTAVGALLTSNNHMSLILCAIRFFRLCIGVGDSDYIVMVIRGRHIEDIVELFVKNKHRYNMLHSSVLEMITFISSQNIVDLKKQLEKFSGDFKMFSSLKSVFYEDEDDLYRPQCQFFHEDKPFSELNSSNLFGFNADEYNENGFTERPSNEDDADDFFSIVSSRVKRFKPNFTS